MRNADGMNPDYVPETNEEILGYLVEEAGEVLAAVGKTQRHGLGNWNPELPPNRREYNAEWILRELVDLERAIKFTRAMLLEEGWKLDADAARGEGES